MRYVIQRNMAARDKKKIEDTEDIGDIQTSDADEESQAPVVETEEEETKFWADDKMPAKDEAEQNDSEDETPVSQDQDESEPETSHEESLDKPQDVVEDTEAEEAPLSDIASPDVASSHDSDLPSNFQGVTEASAGGNKLKVGAIVIAVLALLGGGFWAYQLRQAQTSDVAGDSTESLDVIETPAPTVAPSVEVDFSELKVQVLNGSGTPGEAAKVQELLEAEGFEEFNTGNAKAYTYKETEVSVKPGASEEVYEHVKETLGENYSVTTGDELDETSEYDVVI